MTIVNIQNTLAPVLKKYGVSKVVLFGIAAFCPERATHTSVGQRPTLGTCRNFKTESLADCGMGNGLAFISKAYSLDFTVRSIRRAMPYANSVRALP
jgi:hypothetical protein